MTLFAQRSSETIVIPKGASVSGVIDLTNTAMLGFVTPDAWTTAALNIEVSNDGTNWSSAYDSYGSQVGSVATPIVASRYAVDVTSMLPWVYARFRSGTSASPVTQGAERTFKVIKRFLA